MRKAIKIFIYFILCIMVFSTTVKANNEACKINLTADKTTLNPGDEVTITLTMSEITKTSGIVQYLSVLEFSEDVFDVITEDDPELKSALENTEFANCDILYNGENDTDSIITTPWYLLYMEMDGERGLFGNVIEDPQTNEQTVGKIKLKVKDNANATSVAIGMVEIEVYDAEAISSGAISGDKIQDSEIELKINGKIKDEIPNTNTTSQNSNILNTNANINKQTENKATQDVPYTGIEDWVPFIFIGIIICVIAYINYRKYKDI